MENQQAQTQKREDNGQQSRHRYQTNLRQNKEVSVKTIVPVHKDYVGAVIGKGGAMINQIKTDTETRISYMDQDFARGHQAPIFQITGPPKGVGRAEKWVRRILQSTWQAEQEDKPVEAVEEEGQNPMEESN
jgi:predicted PilT family ATPase